MKYSFRMWTLHLLLTCMFSIGLSAQSDSCWTVLLLGKGNELEVKEDMSSYSTSGFYLYRNTIYEIETKDRKFFGGRLIDIKQDTLYFTNFFNTNAAAVAGFELDTIAVYYERLDKLKLISDRAMGLYTKHSFSKFNFIFAKDTTHCRIESRWGKIFTNVDEDYELAPHLTAQGINLLYEEMGRTFYFYGGGMMRPDRSKMDTTYDVRHGFWFTPCHVEKINGIALGLSAENIKNSPYYEKDSLVINGLNVEINPFAIFMLMNPHFVGPLPDSIEIYNEFLKKDIETTINGLNVSLVNTINEARLNGVSISSCITLVDEIHGFSLSGISNFAYRFNGVSIAAFYNRATVAKGLQIGLVNKATKLRGFQIGLWNTNGRRSLPFINWQFWDKP